MSKDFSVTQNGEKLNPSLYTWDEKTRTFSTEESNLVLDFSDLDNCTFKTGYDCTFKTGSRCTFDTDSDCILIRRDIFEFYDISNTQIQTCPYKIKGYIRDGYYYIGNEKQYPAIIVDGILSEIINKKGNVYKVKNYGSDKITYLIKDGNTYCHDETLKQARERV